MSYTITVERAFGERITITAPTMDDALTLIARLPAQFATYPNYYHYPTYTPLPQWWQSPYCTSYTPSADSFSSAGHVFGHQQ